MHRQFLVATLVGACLAAPATHHAPSPRVASGFAGCNPVSIDVSVASNQTKAFPPDFDLSQLPSDPSQIPALIDSIPFINTTARYTIKGRLCAPTGPSISKAWKLQILAHGNTYTKDYWHGAGPNGQDEYSWVKAATNNGYHTLALDLPCNGESTRAHPITECQLPLDAEAMNAIIKDIRAGKMCPRPGAMYPAPESITFVGYSYGSLVANALAAYYPKAADAYVLTGFSGALMTGGLGALLIPDYQPVDPKVPAYVRAANKAGVQQLFFDGNFDQAIADLDYDYRGTVALGEVLTASQGQATVPDYRGSVFVLNGNEDEIMCQSDPAGPFNGIKGDCSAGFSQKVSAMYPNARTFSYYNAPSTGHSLDLHKSAQASFKIVQSWISANVRPL